MEIGLIGVGRWGINYLKTLNEMGVAVKWICASTQKSLDKALEINTNAETTTNYADILNDEEVEAVIIATPGATHYQIAKEALQAGKHVLVEKPLALNAKEAEELVRLAGKKVLMVGHLHRYNAAIVKIKADIKEFGKIRYINSVGTNNTPRSDMSALWDFGPHDLTIISYLLGEYPKSVSANGNAFLKEGIEDVFNMSMKFSETFATAMGTWLYPEKTRKLVVVGEKMSAIYDDYAKADKLKYYRNGDCEVQELEHLKPLTEQLKHFLDCAENNKKPLTDGADGLKVVKVLEAAKESINKGGAPVKIVL